MLTKIMMMMIVNKRLLKSIQVLLTSISLEIDGGFGCVIFLKGCNGTGVKVSEVTVVSHTAQLAVDYHFWQRQVQAAPLHACPFEHYPAHLVPRMSLHVSIRKELIST